MAASSSVRARWRGETTTRQVLRGERWWERDDKCLEASVRRVRQFSAQTRAVSAGRRGGDGRALPHLRSRAVAVDHHGLGAAVRADRHHVVRRRPARALHEHTHRGGGYRTGLRSSANTHAQGVRWLQNGVLKTHMFYKTQQGLRWNRRRFQGEGLWVWWGQVCTSGRRMHEALPQPISR